MIGAHERSASVVADRGDVVGVPVEIGDRSVVLSCIEDDQIEELAHFEVPPDAQVVVEIDLTDRHPLKVSTDSVHLALINGNATAADEGAFGVVDS